MYLILAILVVSITACSKDDSTSDDGGGTTGSVGKPGDPHGYDIKITAGQNAGYNMSGKVANEEGGALYFLDPESGYPKSVTVIMGNEDMGFSGSFHIASNGNVVIPDLEVWNVTSHEINKSFMADDITVTVSNVQYKGLPEAGYASFKLTFEGTFYLNIDETDIYEIKGSIVMNFPPM